MIAITSNYFGRGKALRKLCYDRMMEDARACQKSREIRKDNVSLYHLSFMTRVFKNQCYMKEYLAIVLNFVALCKGNKVFLTLLFLHHSLLFLLYADIMMHAKINQHHIFNRMHQFSRKKLLFYLCSVCFFLSRTTGE